MSHRYIDQIWLIEPIYLAVGLYLLLGFITANVVIYRMVQIEKETGENIMWHTTVLAFFVWLLWPLFIGLTVYGIIDAYRKTT